MIQLSVKAARYIYWALCGPLRSLRLCGEFLTLFQIQFCEQGFKVYRRGAEDAKKRRENWTIFCFLLISLWAPIKDSQLNYLIAPEIKNDTFYQAIQTLAEQPDIQTILEIGSSNGEGSTEALVRGLRNNPRKPHLFCLEISQPRFVALKNRYAANPQVHCYRLSSVPLSSFPTEADLIAFHRQHSRELSKSNADLLAQILWLHQDIDYIQSQQVPQNGIAHIQSTHHIPSFDLVLIDGSEFTGEAELSLVYGAKYLLLDDVKSYKNFRNRQKLLRDPSYQLIQEDLTLRNGFSIFRKKA